MGYPISNLKKDFEDINRDNRTAIKEYSDALIQAIETGDFTKLPTVYYKYKDKLDKVIINADVLNNLTNYVEDLRNYTIAVKNQVFFCDVNITNNEFNQLYSDLSVGDIIIFTEIVDGNKIFKCIKVKQANGSYQTVVKIGISTYYIEITDDDIYSLEETGESVNTVFHMGAKDSVSTNTSGNYLNLSELDAEIKNLNDGDTISIRYIGIGNTIDYFKLNDKFYLIDMRRKSQSQGGYLRNKSISLTRDTICDFIFSINGLSKISETLVSGNRDGGIVTCDKNGNIIDENMSLFIPKNYEYDTGWVNCVLNDSNISPYVTGTEPQVRRIGNIVHLRGTVAVKKITRIATFNLPSNLFYPSKNEIFIQCSEYINELGESINDMSDTSPITKHLCVMSNGEVRIFNSSNNIIISSDALNCNATWFVD